MRAIGVYEFGGPAQAKLLELPDPVARDGQVVIRAEATTVNPADSVMIAGLRADVYESRPRPIVPGMEVAGTIVDVGPGAPWSLGDAVIAVTGPARSTGGAHAELVVVSANSVALAPKGIDATEAATLPMNGLTVRIALETLDLPPGSVLGVTGAAGAVGRNTIEMGRAAGLIVVAQTAEKDAKDVLDLGAHHWVDRHDDWRHDMWSVTGRGVDALMDAGIVGSSAQGAVRDGGAIAALRAFDGEAERGITIHEPMVYASFHRRDALAEVVRLAEDGTLTTKVGSVFRPQQFQEALELLERGGHRGRVVIDWR